MKSTLLFSVTIDDFDTDDVKAIDALQRSIAAAVRVVHSRLECSTEVLVACDPKPVHGIH